MNDILIIDDEPEYLKLLAMHLEEDRWKVRLAQSGEEGLVEIAKHRPDLIVLDALMPEMDGVAFSERLKEDPAYASIPVILLSGLVYLEGKPGARDIADYYIAKTTAMSEITKKIRIFIEERKKGKR